MHIQAYTQVFVIKIAVFLLLSKIKWFYFSKTTYLDFTDKVNLWCISKTLKADDHAKVPWSAPKAKP